MRQRMKTTIKEERNEVSENKSELQFLNIDGVPIVVCQPNESTANGSLAVWIPYLGGNRETGKRELIKLASAGYLALSLDPWLHGDRKGTDTKGLRGKVFKEFRAYMWPILGITALDTYRVIDWAIKTYRLNDNVVIGGVSMGGDIAIALAGIDKRITKVAVIASTPNWMRPGMTDVLDHDKVIDQGIPTPFGEWLCKLLNPMTNRSAFFRAPNMLIELGALDTHIAPQWALAFKEALNEECPIAGQAITITVNDNCNHLSLIQRHSIANRAITFLTTQI